MDMTDEQKIARTKRLVSAARAVISGQVGITVGTFAISNKLYWLGRDWEEKYNIFKEYRSVLPLELPVGAERLKWNLDRILEFDPILAKIEYQYRSRILETCVEIIKKHG